MSDQVKELLIEVIKLQKEQSFDPRYVDKVTDKEALGLAISQYFKWDGQAIFETASSGFEDSNFHKFNEEFQKLWEKSN